MRVLMLNWRDITHPEAGGAEKYMHEIGRRLAEKHEVTLFCARYPGSADQETIDGITVLRRGGKYSQYVRAAFGLLASSKRYDVVIDDINGVPFLSPLFTRKPVIAVIHHVVGWRIFRKELPLPLAILGYVGERSIPLIYRGSQFVTVSESSRGDLIELGIPSDRIEMVMNGIDMECKESGTRSSCPQLAYVGRIKDYKRLDHVIRAFKAVREVVPDGKLVIAGRGDVSDLRILASEMGLGDSVIFRGEVSEAEKEEILSSAWGFVTASLKEGWGISVIEANARGTPAIAYDVPGLRDSIRNGRTGLLVPEGNEASLAEAMTTMLTYQERRHRLGSNCLSWAMLFNWNKSAEEFEHIIVKWVGNSARARRAWLHRAMP